MSRLQAAADIYLGRMNEGARWNNRRGHRAGEKFGPTLPVAHEADAAEEKTNVWYVGGSAKREARELFLMAGRNGHTIEELRGDISITTEEMVQVDRWCEQEPCLASRIRGAINYRGAVLAAFDKLVENDAALTRSKTAAAD